MNALPIYNKSRRCMKYKPKTLKFQHTCKSCFCIYMSADVKGAFCEKCKQPRLCACGCGKTVFTPGKKYSRGCKLRGKTYNEIYTNSTPNCGFKQGDKNPMFNIDSKLKQSLAIKQSYTEELRNRRRVQKLHYIDQGLIYGKMRYCNDNGEKFRSILEFKFSELLISNNVSYEYEKAIFKLPSNDKGFKRKVVDFKVKNTLIEITGLAYPKWIDEFIYKINLLKHTTDSRIIILTYEHRVESIECLKDNRTFIFNFFDIQNNFSIINNYII